MLSDVGLRTPVLLNFLFTKIRCNFLKELVRKTKFDPGFKNQCQCVIKILTVLIKDICLKMSSDTSPVLPIFCDLCGKDFNSVESATVHFSFKRHWTIRNLSEKPAIFLPGEERRLNQLHKLLLI